MGRHFIYTLWLLMGLLLLTLQQARAEDMSDRFRILDSSMKVAPGPVLIQLSAEWCQYCRMQQYQLERNRDFNALRSAFNYIELDAESRETVVFNGREYRYRPSGLRTGIHELALALWDGQEMAYPGWVLLDKNYRVLFRYNGVLSTGQVKELLGVIARLLEEKA